MGRFYDWFYTFHTIGDFIRGTILLMVLNIAFSPFYVWSIELLQGGSYYFLILSGTFCLIHLGVYIRAIVLWIMFVKVTKYMPKPSSNVDPVWLGIHN